MAQSDTAAKSGEIPKQRENALQLHGVFNRYKNLQEHAAAFAYSKTFSPIYKRKLTLLANADAYCSVAAVDWNLSSVCTFVSGRNVKVEYILMRAPNNFTETAKHLKAIQGAIAQWGSDAFEKQRVCFITSNDELLALMEYGINADDNAGGDTNTPYTTWSQEVLDLANDVKAKLQRSQVDYDIFSVYDTDATVAKFAAQSEEDTNAKEQFFSKIRLNLGNDREPVKVAVRNRN